MAKGGKGKGGGGINMNATAKFAVFDVPGVSQPDLSPAADSKAPAKEGQQGRRAKAGSGPKIEGAVLIGGDSFQKREKDPEWLKQRQSVYESIKARRSAELDSKKQVAITVTMPDGKVLEKDKEGNSYMAWKTTPFDVANTISQGLANAATVARVTYASFAEDYSAFEDGMEGEDMLSDAMADGGVEGGESSEKTLLWDLTRPLVGPVAKMEFLKFGDDKEANTVFWHSSAHMMGEALEHLYGCKLTIGPPLAGGFYYDSYMGSDSIKDDDYKPVEQEVNKIIKQKQKFERMVITKEEGLELFADNPFKVSILTTKVPDGGRTTVYRCGDLIDLCRGPHVPNTGKVKAFAATRHSATNWLGDTNNDSLQRMYGISFPDKKMLKAWQENQEKVRVDCSFVLYSLFRFLVYTSSEERKTNLILGPKYDRHLYIR